MLRPAAEYRVIKLNNIGRRQRRIVKLTHVGIENIKNKDVVTKRFTYSDIRHVELVRSGSLLSNPCACIDSSSMHLECCSSVVAIVQN